MTKNTLLTFVACLAFASYAPWCPAQSPVTLEELESLAWAHNPTLIEATAQVHGAGGAALQAGLYPNPTVGFAAEQIGVKGTPGEFHGGFVEQQFVTAGKLRLSREKYCRRMQVAQHLAAAQQHRVINDVRIHYYRALGASERVRTQRELLKNGEDVLLTAREMHNVGQANEADVLQASVELERRRLDLMRAENHFQQQWETLGAVIGVDHFEPRGLAGSLEMETESIDWQTALHYVLTESPQLSAARAKIQADQITLRREQVEPIPNITIRGAVGHNFEARDTVAGAEASIELPLFDRNQGTIRQAQADLTRALAECRRLELSLRRNLADTFRRYDTARQHVERYKSAVLPQSRKAYQLLLESYKQRRVAWPDVLMAERSYFQTRVDYIDQLVMLREAVVAIDGLLLVDGLLLPPGPVPGGHIDSTPRPR